MFEPLPTQGERFLYRLVFRCHDKAHAAELARSLHEGVKHENNLWKVLEAPHEEPLVLLHLTITKIPGLTPADEMSYDSVLRYIVGYLFTAAKGCDLTLIRSYGKYGDRISSEVHRVTYELINWPGRSVLAFGYPAEGLPAEFLA